MYRTKAYCDQWQKILAVYDDYGKLIAVVKKAEDYDGYYVLLEGNEENHVFYTEDIELGTTKKNMEACFALYRIIRDECGHLVVGSNRIYEIFTHTRNSAKRLGGFSTIDDCKDEIERALKEFEEATADIDLDHVEEAEDDYARERERNRYYDPWWDDEYEDGDGICTNYIGDGVWSDDDGDNWYFD